MLHALIYLTFLFGAFENIYIEGILNYKSICMLILPVLIYFYVNIRFNSESFHLKNMLYEVINYKD